MVQMVSASCMMRLEGEVSIFFFPGLGVDMALAAYNLSTKLMRWTSSIDCDRVGASCMSMWLTVVYA